jgi:hypothetical protein|nr:MAG TPA: hypothetical protein [Caudoviricetes sp.]
MITISGDYAVALTKNQPVPKGSDYWKDRKELTFLFWKFNKEVKRLAKDMGAKIECDDEFINAKVVWRESGEKADELRPFLIGSLSSHAEFHDKFRLCKETVACIDKDLYYYQREYNLLKKCLVGNKEEPIASIMSLGKDIDQKVDAFYTKYRAYLAVDDIKRWYLNTSKLSNTLNGTIMSCKFLTLENKGDSLILYLNGEKIGSVSRDALLFRTSETDRRIMFNDPLGGLLMDLIRKLSLEQRVLHMLEDKRALGNDTSWRYSNLKEMSIEAYKAMKVLDVLLNNPVICIKSEEEVAIAPLRAVQEKRRNMGFFERLWRLLF